MSGAGKARITITVDPHVAAYADRLVATGKATSVSAAFNDALAERVDREHQARAWWDAKVAEGAADPDITARVARMKAHVDDQLRKLEIDRHVD